MLNDTESWAIKCRQVL